MVIYSIKDIEEITGIKAHTLRIWERRYNIIVPQRTKTNIRYYTEENLKEILNISFLNSHGHKISHIAEMSAQEKQDLIAKIANVDETMDKQLDVLSLAVIDLDEKRINLIINKYIENMGFEKTMDLLINPFLEKLSLLWMAGSIKNVHETFISEILKQKTIIEIQKLDKPLQTHPLVMLYLPEGEKQQLSLMFLNYLLRARGINARLIGFDLTLIDVLDAYQVVQPDYIYSIINDDIIGQSFHAYLNYLCKSIGECKFALAGFKSSLSSKEIPENCIILNDLDTALAYFSDLQNS